ncbi:MAG: hypothetical protein JXA68_06055 [Ignavibacteriales bacterium]|nr:hypothetical protein [Ignavibacteriales bacterium]
MMDYFDALNFMGKIYFICAIGGGTIFIVRMIMMIIGGDFGGDGDLDVHTDFDHSGIGDHDAGLHILTFQGITAFIMMFGLVGLVLYENTAIGSIFILLFSIGAGVLVAYFIAFIFKKMKKLEADGTVNLLESIGCVGTVYLTIKGKDGGKVQVVVKEQLLTLDAISENDEVIKTGEEIIVTNVINDNLLVVNKY